MEFATLKQNLGRICELNKLQLEEFKVIGDQKSSAVIASSERMASVEVLSDGTYDFMSIEIISEDVLHTRTTTAESVAAVIELITSDLRVSGMAN